MKRDSLFYDRRDAGRQLSEALQSYRDERPIALALPRGGVPVGYEVAAGLEAPLGVLVVRKIGAPLQPEFGIGAVAPGVTVRYAEAIEEIGISEADFERAAEQARRTMQERDRLYNGHDALPNLKGRVAILIDDGLATGVTAEAASRAARRLEPDRLVMAVPVGAAASVATLRDEVDELVCLHVLQAFGAVGDWYEHFDPTTDEEVIELLEEANRTVTVEDLREPG